MLNLNDYTLKSLSINEKDIKQYLEFLFDYCEKSDDKYVGFRSFPEGKDVKGKNVLNFYSLSDEKLVENIIKDCNDAHLKDKSSFVIPRVLSSKSSAKEEDILETCVICIDIDSDDIDKKYEHIVKHIGVPSLVVASGGVTKKGNEKLHVYYKLNEVVDGDDLKTVSCIQGIIADKSQADPSMKRITQPIRIAGSVHQKNGEKHVYIKNSSVFEYGLDDILAMVEDMPYMDGVTRVDEAFNLGNYSLSEDINLYDKIIVKEGEAGITRYDALSKVMGTYVREHYDGKISKDDMVRMALEYNTAHVSPPWPDNTVIYNLENIWNKHKTGADTPQIKYVKKTKEENTLRVFSFKEMYNDKTPTPDDLIDGLIEPGGNLLVAGPPKSMKTMFTQKLMQCAACGKELLNMKIRKPLKVFYIQAEMKYFGLRDRVQMSEYTEEEVDLIDSNLFITDHFKWLMDKNGADKVISSWLEYRGDEKPDIIVLDPLANICDAEENDSKSMMEFLNRRLEYIKQGLNPEASIILVHHSRKAVFQDIAEAPFQNGIRGSSGIQGWYDSGIIIARESSEKPERHMWFERRNGPGLHKKVIKFDDGDFVELDNYDSSIQDTNLDLLMKRTKYTTLEGFLINEYKNKIKPTYKEFVNSIWNEAKKVNKKYKRKDVKQHIDNCIANKRFYFSDREQFGSSVKDSNMYAIVGEDCPYRDIEVTNNETGELIITCEYVKPTHYFDVDKDKYVKLRGE